MRIVAIVERAWIGQGPSGGAERMIHLLMSYLVDQGWEAVGVVVNGLPLDQMVDGVRVLVTQDQEIIHNVAKTADIIITHLGGTPRARGLARVCGKPLVQLVHNTSEYTVGYLADGCDFAIYNSEWVKEFHDLHKQDRVVKSLENRQTIYIRPRVCFDWPDAVVRPPVLDPSHKTSTGDRITLVNLTPNKGPDLFYRLAEMNPDLNFMGVIGGYEPTRQVVQHLPNVSIHDHTRDMSEVYSQSAVMLMPSLYESYGLIAVEAAQYGIPTIASDTPGLRECLGPMGIIRDRDDIDSWNRALRHTLEYYEGASSLARTRYDDLYRQSQLDLPLFAAKMEEVACDATDNSGCRSGL